MIKRICGRLELRVSSTMDEAGEEDFPSPALFHNEVPDSPRADVPKKIEMRHFCDLEALGDTPCTCVPIPIKLCSQKFVGAVH
jgi:hypothetical protein